MLSKKLAIWLCSKTPFLFVNYKGLTFYLTVECADNLDSGIREESHSEDEESSSSSDEMLFESSSQRKHSRGRSTTSEDTMSYSSRRSAEVSMPGSSILENIDTPPPFRKRTLAMSQDEQPRKTSTTQNTSSVQTVNGQLCKC